MITEYHFEKLNVGGSLECLLHSFINNEQVLIIDPLYPFQLKTLKYVSGLKFIGYESNREIYKSEMWDRLSFLLSMSGQVIFPNIIKTYREDINRFILITEFNKRIIITCDEVTLFEKLEDDFVSVYDWFNVRSGNNHNYDTLTDSRNDFVHTLYFYKANRIGSNGVMRDVCAESRLSKEELLDAYHTEGIAKFKTLKMMAKAGIRGQSNGYSKIGTQLHYALKIEHTHREVIEDYTPNRTLDEILQDRRQEGKAWDLAKRLFRHNQISILQGSYRLPANL
tara:strand:+ start:531 stop:1373 length:843 start_codon:yes stop_codon:yes gene_type:complete